MTHLYMKQVLILINYHFIRKINKMAKLAKHRHKRFKYIYIVNDIHIYVLNGFYLFLYVSFCKKQKQIT